MEPTVFADTPEGDLVCFKCQKVLEIFGSGESESMCAPIDSFRGFTCCSEHKDEAITEARKWLKARGFVSPFSISKEVLENAVQQPFSVMRNNGEVEDGWHVTVVTSTAGSLTYENFPKCHEDGKWSMTMENDTIGMRNYIPSQLNHLLDALEEVWTMDVPNLELVPECTEQLEESSTHQ